MSTRVKDQTLDPDLRVLRCNGLDARESGWYIPDPMARGGSEADSRRWIPIQDVLDAVSEREEVEWIRLRGSYRELGLDLNEFITGRLTSPKKGRPAGRGGS